VASGRISVANDEIRTRATGRCRRGTYNERSLSGPSRRWVGFFFGCGLRSHRAPIRWPGRASALGPSGCSHAAGDRPAALARRLPQRLRVMLQDQCTRCSADGIESPAPLRSQPVARRQCGLDVLVEHQHGLSQLLGLALQRPSSCAAPGVRGPGPGDGSRLRSRSHAAPWHEPPDPDVRRGSRSMPWSTRLR